MEIKELEEYIGRPVAVYAGSSVRNSFDTAMSIVGDLQQHPEEKECFRIVLSQGTYTYFKASEVEHAGWATKDGSDIVLHLTIPQDEEEGN